MKKLDRSYKMKREVFVWSGLGGMRLTCQNGDADK